MAVEIDGKVIPHEKPTKYSELIFEHIQKVEKLKVLQKEVDELADILLILDKSLENRTVGNYGDYRPHCNHVWGTGEDCHKSNRDECFAICVKCGFRPKLKEDEH